MKRNPRLLLPLLMAIVMMVMSPTRMWAQGTSFMVMSDTHVMSKNLFDDGTAFATYVQSEPKLVENSQDIFDAAIARIKTAKPEFVLIPGDLTKDGEKVSHEYVAGKLKELVAQGIKVYVVPGNHDIGNPNANSYSGDAPSAVTSLTADEFQSSDFYQSCGYASAVMTSGLSYMVYPADGIALIALDSRKPDTETTHYSEGGLTEATLAWAETAAAKARKEGRVIIGMMHHPIVEHFDGHKDIGPTYLANQASEYPTLATVQQRLVAAGIGTMFTGHFHLQSIQYEETTAGRLYDVMTGSLSSYPMAMRSGTIATNGNITVASITDVASSELISKALLRNKITTQGVFAVLANKMAAMISAFKANSTYAAMLTDVPSTQAEIMSLLNTHMRDSYEVLMNSLAAGDENQDNPDTKITACTNAYDAFLAALFTNANDLIKNSYPTLMSDYTAQNTAMVTSVFQNTKGTGVVVADNTNTSLKTIPLATIDAATLKAVLDKIDEACAEITFAYSYSGSDEGTSVGTGIKLYQGEDSDSEYIVAPTKAGDVIMAPADCSELFKDLRNLTSVTFDNFNTSNVTDMSLMFSWCDKLYSLDLSSFNTSKVTNMAYMFNGCTVLSSLTIGNFDMSNLYPLGANGIFDACNGLTTLTMKSLPYLVDGTFNTQFSGDCKEVYVELDDNSVVYIPTAEKPNSLPAATTEPTYTREMTNQWGTLVLPFSVTIDSENQPFDFYQVSSVSNDELQLTEMTGTLAAGTPALIRMSEAAKDAETDKYALSLTADNTAVQTAITNPDAVDGLTLTGAYAETNLTDVAGYIIANNTFWNIQSIKGENQVKIAPFRAYLAGTVTTSGSNAPARLTIGTDDKEATALDALEAITEGEAEYYDLAGHRLPELRNGVNIVRCGGRSYRVIVNGPTPSYSHQRGQQQILEHVTDKVADEALEPTGVDAEGALWGE